MSKSDGGVDLRAVRRWMDDQHGVGTAGPLAARLIAGGRSNPTYELNDGERSWILRRPPLGHVLPTAHDMGREYRVISALRDSAVPVPDVVGLCIDPGVIGASFYVMDKLEGITLRTQGDTAQLALHERAALAHGAVRILVALHEVDPEEVGLGGWGRPSGYLERQLGRWRQQWEASKTAERPEIGRVLNLLTHTMPTQGLPGIVHGDFKLDNIMVDRADRTRIVGLLDWEMSTLGDTLTDLGILCSFWDEEGEVFNPITNGATALSGFPKRAEVVAAYAEARGIDVADLAWYMVFADFKIAVILEGIHARHLQGHTEGDDFAGVGAMVGPLLDRALDMSSALAVPSGRR